MKYYELIVLKSSFPFDKGVNLKWQVNYSSLKNLNTCDKLNINDIISCEYYQLIILWICFELVS